MNPSRLAFSMPELLKIKVWIDKLEMKEEAMKLKAALRNLISSSLEWFYTRTAYGPLMIGIER
jgi:hypothetical protein